MTSNSRHGLPPRLMAHQPTRFAAAQESKPSPSPGIRIILGLGSSAIGPLGERTPRFTILLHLPRMAGHGCGVRVKNGPALAGHGAEAVRDAITRAITPLPEQLRRSLTWD